MNVGISAAGCAHCGKTLLLAALLITSASAAEEERRKQNEQRGTETKMKVSQQQRLCVNRVCVAGELPLHNTERQGNLIYTINLMCLERIIMSIQ